MMIFFRLIQTAIFPLLFLTTLQLKAQDTLLPLRIDLYDKTQSLSESWIYEYNEYGNEIVYMKINHSKGDTIFNFKIYSGTKLEKTINYSSRHQAYSDTSYFKYIGDTTVVTSKSDGYKQVYKLYSIGKPFYYSTKTVDNYLNVLNHRVDSTFYSEDNRVITTISYKMSAFSGDNEVRFQIANDPIPVKQKVPIGGILKKRIVKKNEFGEIISEKEITFPDSVISFVNYEFDDFNRFVKSDSWSGGSSEHWMSFAKYDTINDSLYHKTWDNTSLGYTVTIKPLNSTQQFFSTSNYFGPHDELISSTYFRFNEKGYPIEAKSIWYSEETPINEIDFDFVQTTKYTYVSYPISLFDKD